MEPPDGATNRPEQRRSALAVGFVRRSRGNKDQAGPPEHKELHKVSCTAHSLLFRVLSTAAVGRPLAAAPPYKRFWDACRVGMLGILKP